MTNINTKNHKKTSLLSLLTAIFLLICSAQGHASIEIPSDSELIAINFWADDTDMELDGEIALDNAIREFNCDPWRLSFKIKGTSHFSIESDDIGLRRAKTIKAYLIKEGIDPSNIKILSSKGRKCLLLLSS